MCVAGTQGRVVGSHPQGKFESRNAAAFGRHRAGMVIELMDARGIVLRRDALAAGYDDNALARCVRAGFITRVRQGAYVSTAVWADLDKAAQHDTLSRAVLKQYDDSVALTHDSAVVRHDGPTHGLDLGSVHLLHLPGSTGRRNVAGIVHHKGSVHVLDVTRDDDDWLTSPARTILDVAMTRGVEAGIIVADDFIRRGLASKPELWLVSERVKDWPGALILRLVIERCDGKAESVGESLGRELFRKHRLPLPIPQFEVFRHDGSLAGRTDWAWPEHRLLGEFDGKVKYLRLRKRGETVTQAVLREKQREDELRELTDFKFIRLIWADLFRGERTAGRVRAKLRRPAA